MNFTDKEILKIFLPHITDDKRDFCYEGRPKNQFSLDDLVGCKLTNKRLIKNPKPYKKGIEEPNPEHFLVLELDSEKYLLVESWGSGGGLSKEFYYYDGESVRYAHELFRESK